MLDRNRGGAFLILGLLGIGVLAVFLFLTYYLQQTKGYSPNSTGLAYLPLTAVLVISAGVTNTRLLPRTGPWPLIALGMALTAVSFALSAQLDVHSSHATDVLPRLLVAGVGLGPVFAPATDIATRGVDSEGAGVASALVNATNQVGGSLGLALLSTFSVTAAGHYPAAGTPTRASSPTPPSTATPRRSGGEPASSPPVHSSARCCSAGRTAPSGGHGARGVACRGVLAQHPPASRTLIHTPRLSAKEHDL